jgi:hypothetical protein
MPVRLLLAPLALLEALFREPSSKLGVLWCRGGVEGWLSPPFGDSSRSNDAPSKGKDPNDRLPRLLVMLVLLMVLQQDQRLLKNSMRASSSRQGQADCCKATW